MNIKVRGKKIVCLINTYDPGTQRSGEKPPPASVNSTRKYLSELKAG